LAGYPLKSLEHLSKRGLKNDRGQRGIGEVEKMDERDRLYRMTEYERALWDQGFQLVAGMDEAGRGPLAGPVVAACVLFPPGVTLEGINDSKKISPKKRNELYDRIMSKALAVGIGIIGAEEIDRLNILKATRNAMEMAVQEMDVQPDYLLVDALEDLEIPILHKGIIKGDEKSHSIAAASIVAKVTRDRYMGEMDRYYPKYGFGRHKGYGTKEHIQAIHIYGPCPIHRKTFIRKFTV
jgi:ribonuclease HII